MKFKIASPYQNANEDETCNHRNVHFFSSSFFSLIVLEKEQREVIMKL